MKRACLLLLPAILLIALATIGCNDESKPVITRMNITPKCGVMPLNIEAFAAISGGDESGDPMGGTNNLEITWNFGDGGSGNTSIAYHQYTVADTYNIVVTAKDPEGNTTSATTSVTVLADSLMVIASSDFPAGDPAVGEPVSFEVSALGCAVNYPAVQTDDVKLTFKWSVFSASGDTTYFHGSAPVIAFDTAGQNDVEVAVTYPALAITRTSALTFEVTTP